MHCIMSPTAHLLENLTIRKRDGKTDPVYVLKPLLCFRHSCHHVFGLQFWQYLIAFYSVKFLKCLCDMFGEDLQYVKLGSTLLQARCRETSAGKINAGLVMCSLDVRAQPVGVCEHKSWFQVSYE